MHPRDFHHQGCRPFRNRRAAPRSHAPPRGRCRGRGRATCSPRRVVALYEQVDDPAFCSRGPFLMNVTGSSHSTRSPGGRGPRGGAKSDFALALGVERLGLVSLSHPWIIAFAAMALMIAAGFGVGRLKVDDSLSQLFRSNTPEFRQYEEVTTRNFPRANIDVLVVIEGKDLLARENRRKTARFRHRRSTGRRRARRHLDFFRAPAPEGGQMPAPLFPEPLPEGAAYHKLLERVMTNEITVATSCRRTASSA